MLTVNPKYEFLRPWLTTLPSHFDSDGEVIYEARNTIRRVSLDGLTLVVKRFHKPSLFNRIVYSTIRKPKAVRAYRNAELLNSHGISSPEPVAYLLQGTLLSTSYLVTVCSPLNRRFYEFREHGIEGYESLLDQLGQVAARMNSQQLLHRDFSPGNILFDNIDGEWRIDLVDVNRMYVGPVSLRRGCCNFARLWGSQELIDRVARAYGSERGFDPDVCSSIAIRAWRKFWRHRK